MKSRLLIQVVLMLVAVVVFARSEAKKKDIGQLLEIRMTKELVSNGKMSTVEKDYYERVQKWQLRRKENQGQQQNVRIDIQRITVSQGKLSVDSNYIATWKFVSLGSIIDGVEQRWRDHGSFMIHADLTLLDKNLKTLWKRRLVWPKGYYGAMSIRHVGNNGNILLARPPFIDSFPAGAFDVDSTAYEVYDKKGHVVYSLTVEGGGMLGEKYSVTLTDNGRIIKFHERNSQKRYFYDIYTGGGTGDGSNHGFPLLWE